MTIGVAVAALALLAIFSKAKRGFFVAALITLSLFGAGIAFIAGSFYYFFQRGDVFWMTLIVCIVGGYSILRLFVKWLIED